MAVRDSDPLRVGVLGTRAGLVHVHAWRSVPGVEVVGLAGRDTSCAALAGAALDVPGVAGLGALLELGVDVVSVALPPVPQALALATLVGGEIPFVVEPPVGARSTQTSVLARSVAQVGLAHGVALTLPTMATFERTRALALGGELGPLRSVAVVHRERSWSHVRRRPTWRQSLASGGGVLATMGSPVFHALATLFGPRSGAIDATIDDAATRAVALDGADVAEDKIDVDLRFGEVVASVHLSSVWEGSPGHRWDFELDGGSLRIDVCDVGGTRLSIARRGGVLREILREPIDEELDERGAALRPILAGLAGALRGRPSPIPTLSDLARAQELGAEARRAAEAGVGLAA